MTFGEKLQKLRRESSLSQEKLAEQLHVSRQAVSRRELGTAAPDVDNIVRLSKFFQVSLEYLMVEDCEEPVQAAAPTTPRRRKDSGREARPPAEMAAPVAADYRGAAGGPVLWPVLSHAGAAFLIAGPLVWWVRQERARWDKV